MTPKTQKAEVILSRLLQGIKGGDIYAEWYSYKETLRDTLLSRITRFHIAVG